MKIEYPHTLGLDDARVRLTALGDLLKARFGVGFAWDGDQARVTGKYLVVTIEGTLTLRPGLVVFEAKDPGLLWRGKAKNYITGKLEKYLDPAISMEQIPRA